jgi:precorrin-8X/cobalt-precorrin-8 methylmutase
MSTRMMVDQEPADAADRSPCGTARPHRDYLREGAEIYRQSFATIRAEAELSGLPPALEPVVVRMIHACGMVDLTDDVQAHPRFAEAARQALEAGAPILCDAQMVASGITRRRLPADNEIVCTLGDPRVPGLASELGTTRSAAALDLWAERLDGAVVALGNAPTALFHLLDRLRRSAGPGVGPAAVIGTVVGFIGAAESKAELAAYGTEHDLPYLVVHGRRGGSAITAAAINALASDAL